MLGLSCVSLLSDSLKRYINTPQKSAIGFSFDANETAALKQGFPAAYRIVLGAILNTDWSDCPANFAVIEQVVLARNRDQNSEDLTSLHNTYDRAMLKKHPLPIFANMEEVSMLTAEDGSLATSLMPSITVTWEALFAAIDEVEKLAGWIYARLGQVHVWRKLQRATPQPADRSITCGSTSRA